MRTKIVAGNWKMNKLPSEAPALIEAIESQDGRVFGVQWHPECMYRTSPETRLLFREFVKKV